jgi:hypothetical protein
MATPDIQTACSAVSSIGLRKVITHTEDVYAEGGRALSQRLRKAVACAVFRNPWAGQGFVEDLWDEMNRVGAILSELLTGELIELADGVDEIRGFGKCAVVGIAGEIEHGAGIIHGPHFGPRFRDLVKGASAIPFTERRSIPGPTMSIPTAHKTERSTRAYYSAVDVTFEDAPHADEIAIALAVVTGPRPHARIGDLTTDAEWAARG